MDDASPAAATLANWRTAPFSRWAFQHVDALIPTAEIAPGEPTPLPDDLQDFDDLAIPLPGGRTLDFETFLTATATDALVVLKNGRVALERYANGMTADTRHIAMSATKSFVGLIVGALVRDGALDMAAPVSAYAPEVAESAWKAATIRDLVDMRTGVAFDEAQARAYALATGWDPVPADAASTGLRGFFPTVPEGGAPGGPFRYVSANTDLLGLAIERATGQTFAKVASERLWAPMGAEQSARMTLDRDGLARCTGGLCATARDLARLGQLFAQDGRRDGAEVVPAAWIDDIATNGDRAAWAQGEFAGGFGGLPMSYRSGWYVIHQDPTLVFAMGIHGQNIFVDRARQIVIVKLSSQAQPTDPRDIGLTHLGVRAILRRLA